MIRFATNSALPIEAATTMGVSVKESEGAIGKFGTGLKYAIAGILRLGGSVEFLIDDARHVFSATDSEIRGKTFRIVNCNGVPCGFTTELGKHWEPWMLFRELASNTLDENGNWWHGEGEPPQGTRTLITVKCREVEDSERDEQVFRMDSPSLLSSSLGANVYEGESRHYYYKGIRAGSFSEVAPVTIDVSSGTLSEDRMLDMHQVRMELAWAFRTAESFDNALMIQVIRQDQPGMFWVDNVSAGHLSVVPDAMMSFMLDRPKFVCNPAFRGAMDRHLKKEGIGKWVAVDMSERLFALVEDGERMCDSIGVDAIPRERVRFTKDLDDRTLAVTHMDTRDVWFSTKLAMLGRDEFLCGYLEEAMHAMTGFGDCTREFQNAFMSVIVSTYTRSKP